MRQTLVINADDGGMDAATDAAILQCAEAGGLTSVSIMPKGQTASTFIDRAIRHGLGIGLHLNLTEGRASCPIDGLTDKTGAFPTEKEESWERLERGAIDLAALRREILTQWEALLSIGAKPDHINGHNHIHVFPIVAEQLQKAIGHHLPALHARVPFERSAPHAVVDRFPAAIACPAAIKQCKTTSMFIGHAFSEVVNWSALSELKGSAVPTAEWMVHPGSRVGSDFTHSPNRDLETLFLCREELQGRLADWGWTLGRFRDIL